MRTERILSVSSSYLNFEKEEAKSKRKKEEAKEKKRLEKEREDAVKKALKEAEKKKAGFLVDNLIFSIFGGD
jgi:hypothetical protein